MRSSGIRIVFEGLPGTVTGCTMAGEYQQTDISAYIPKRTLSSVWYYTSIVEWYNVLSDQFRKYFLLALSAYFNTSEFHGYHVKWNEPIVEPEAI